MKSSGKFALVAIGLIAIMGASTPKIDTNGLFPDGFTQIDIPSFGWGQKGKIKIGDFEGDYQRTKGTNSSSLFGIDKERNAGTVALQLSDTKNQTKLSADCKAMQKSVGSGMISVSTKSWRLECEIIGPNGAPIKMQLAENPEYSMSKGNLREGTLIYGETTYNVNTIHTRLGGARSFIPMGYNFSIAGKSIGAAETNGANRILISKTASDQENALVQIAGAVFVVMWDIQQ